jgi:uncharacterized membrane protein
MVESSENFFARHKTFWIVILLIIVAIILWKYFWKKESLSQNLTADRNWIEREVNQLESDLGINPTFSIAPANSMSQ